MARPRLLATILLALACGPPPPDVEVDGWALARAALVDGESCYDDRPDYCIREPAFVDAAIQGALDGRFGGVMPKMGREVEAVIRSARVGYQRASQEDARLREIEGLVAARYAAPVIDTSDPELVNVDLGALPGKLAVRRFDIVLTDSPMVEDFWWASAEAGRVLAEHADAHPEKAIVRVELRMPTGSSSEKTLVYRYFRDEGAVAFGELLEGSIYVSPPLEGGPRALAEGRQRLSVRDARFCSRSRAQGEAEGDGEVEWCPWSDPYGEAAREAARAARRR